MGDLEVTVTDSTGQPVPGATISIEQTHHEFLFGSTYSRSTSSTPHSKTKPIGTSSPGYSTSPPCPFTGPARPSSPTPCSSATPPSRRSPGGTSSDARAWQGAPAGLLRHDLSPKPAFTALHQKIKQDWWTRASGISDARGRFTTRAFFGSHRVTCTLPDGTRTTSKITLPRTDGRASCKIRLEHSKAR